MRAEIYAVLLILLTMLHLGESQKIHLTKKIKHRGITLTKIHTYTNETLSLTHKALATELALDILIVADYSLYRGAVDMFKGDEIAGEHFAVLYLNAIFEQMRIIYEGIELIDGQTIQLSLVGTFITKREADCPLLNSYEEEFDVERRNYTYEDDNTTLSFQSENSTEMSYTINAHMAIDRFTVWVKKHSELLPKHDHAVLITKFDLLSMHGETTTQGMAYVGNICSLGDSSSVVEDVGAANTALIASHELGHSLGSFHDGTNRNGGCSSTENFLMAVSMSPDPNKIRRTRMLSECSKKMIVENLKRPSTNCIRKLKLVDKSENKSGLLDKLDRKPGELITEHQQCQMALGPRYGICPHRAYYSQPICGRIWCKDRNKPINENCETLSYFPAFDGTECARNKWCINLSCVENPKKMMECKDINAKTCSRFSKAKLKHYCKANDFFDICCRTCMQLKTDLM